MILYLSLGSNISPRHQYVDEACRLLQQRVGEALARSSDFFSAPWGYESNHEYLNIALRLATSLTPMEVLRVTQQIERELGRTVKNHYQDRTIDIDLLMGTDDAGEPLVVQTPELTLPHPLMHERDFVMVPLREIIE